MCSESDRDLVNLLKSLSNVGSVAKFSSPDRVLTEKVICPRLDVTSSETMKLEVENHYSASRLNKTRLIFGSRAERGFQKLIRGLRNWKLL